VTENRSRKVSRLLPAMVAALLIGLLAFGAISAAARDGEETTTTPTPVETPVVEVPVSPPVVQLPPTVETEKPVEVQVGSEKSSSKPVTQPAPSEAATGTSTTGSQTAGTGTSGTAPTTTATPTSRGGTRAAHATSGGHNSSSGNSSPGNSGSQAGAKSTGGGNSAADGANAPSAPLPSHAPTKVATHVEQVLGNKLPKRQLEEAGTALAAHLGLVSKHPGSSQNAEVAKIGQALGTAVVGSAVAVDRQPPAAKPTGPIAIFRAPGEHAVSFLLIVALAILAIFGSFLYLQFRSTRRGALPLQIRVMGRVWEPAKTAIRIETAMQGPRNALESCIVAVRRVGSAATSGLRSFF
jgi:hypothetical protein